MVVLDLTSSKAFDSLISHLIAPEPVHAKATGRDKLSSDCCRDYLRDVFGVIRLLGSKHTENNVSSAEYTSQMLYTKGWPTCEVKEKSVCCLIYFSANLTDFLR